MTVLSMQRDVSGYNVFAQSFPDIAQSITLTSAGGAKSYTVPTGFNNTKWLAVFRQATGADVWVAKNDTAELPVGATFESTTSVLNSPPRPVSAGDVLSFITADTSIVVGIELYAIPQG